MADAGLQRCRGRSLAAGRSLVLASSCLFELPSSDPKACMIMSVTFLHGEAALWHQQCCEGMINAFHTIQRKAWKLLEAIISLRFVELVSQASKKPMGTCPWQATALCKYMLSTTSHLAFLSEGASLVLIEIVGKGVWKLLVDPTLRVLEVHWTRVWHALHSKESKFGENNIKVKSHISAMPGRLKTPNRQKQVEAASNIARFHNIVEPGCQSLTDCRMWRQCRKCLAASPAACVGHSTPRIRGASQGVWV